MTRPDLEAVNVVHSGGTVTCAASDYEKVRVALRVYETRMRGWGRSEDIKHADAAHSEVKRLDAEFGYRLDKPWQPADVKPPELPRPAQGREC